jgi:hypothetical protein
MEIQFIFSMPQFANLTRATAELLRNADARARATGSVQIESWHIRDEVCHRDDADVHAYDCDIARLARVTFCEHPLSRAACGAIGAMLEGAMHA